MRIATDTVPGLGCCAVRMLDRMLLDGGTPAVYSYLFAHPPSPGQPGETSQHSQPSLRCQDRPEERFTLT